MVVVRRKDAARRFRALLDGFIDERVPWRLASRKADAADVPDRHPRNMVSLRLT